MHEDISDRERAMVEDLGWTLDGPGRLHCEVEMLRDNRWTVWLELREHDALLITPLVFGDEDLLIDLYRDKLEKVSAGDPDFDVEIRAGAICATRTVQLEEDVPESLILSWFAPALPDTYFGNFISDHHYSRLATWSAWS